LGHTLWGIESVTLPPETGPGPELGLGLGSWRKVMSSKRFKAEEIVNKLREADTLIASSLLHPAI